MAICLFKADALQNRDKILHILDCAGKNRSFYLKSAAALTEVVKFFRRNFSHCRIAISDLNAWQTTSSSECSETVLHIC